MSVNTSEPVILPDVTGAKFTSRVQLLPCPSVPAEAEEPTEGHAPVSPLTREKLEETLGFVPLVGGSTTSGALPMSEITTASGPSVVSVDPTAVGVAKVSVGLPTFVSRTRLFFVSAT